jgi:hypothetical protein
MPASVLHDLLDQIEVDIEGFTGDGAYDKWSVYEALTPKGTTVVVAPSKTDVASGTGRARGATVARARDVGRRQSKKASGYHCQAHAENTFFRYKRLLGGRLRRREPGAQAVEVLRRREPGAQAVEVRLSCKVLNRMLELGAAKSHSIGR